MSQHQNFDTTFTKIYVGGLPWATREERLISFFQRFGEIIHANVVYDRATNRSQGYGFVTFKYAESATRACMNPNPTIEGRIANCKLASHGANIKHYQSNIIHLAHDDLCYLSPSFLQDLHQSSIFYQPLTTNQIYPQYPQLCYGYLQYPQQYDPVSYQHCPMIYTHQSTNAVNGAFDTGSFFNQKDTYY